MKKKYITISLIAISVSMFGQVSFQETIQNEISFKENSVFTQLFTPSVSSSAMAATPIWEEDFSGGFPQGWSTYTNNTQGGTSTCPWVYTLDGSWGYYQGTQGASAAAGMSSTTALNGFLISDTDSANHHTYGQPSGSTYQYIESSFTTNAIDLSLYPAVSLEFEQLFRYNNLGDPSFTPPTVYVSSDSITWTPFLVNGSISNNTQSSNPETKVINITPVAGGQSTVYLRFGWVSRCYYWMIDDIRIIETPLNLIEIEDVVVGGYWIDYANYAGAGLNGIVGLDYTITPTSQLANHPYVIEGVLRNVGSADQTSMLKYEVSGSGSSSGSSSPTFVSAYSATNIVDSVIVGTTPFSPSIGIYTVAVWGESDSLGVITTSSDTVYKGIEISDYIYGKDLGSSNPGWYRVGSPVTQNHLITRYEMYANEQLYSLRTFISDRSVVGAEVKAIIYEVDTTSTTSGKTFYDESDNYTITAQDLGAWVDIPFVSPVSLLNGYAYSCGIVGFQHPTDSSFIGTSGESMYNGEHSVFDELGLSTQSAGTPSWYYTTSAPMVRMNFDPGSATAQSFDCIGISCIDPGTGNGAYSSLSACEAACPPTGLAEAKSNISIYPNPTNGVFVIELDAATEKYDIRVYNVLGQTVLSKPTNTMVTTIDLSSFDKGIYTVELTDEKAIYTEKIIVE